MLNPARDHCCNRRAVSARRRWSPDAGEHLPFGDASRERFSALGTNAAELGGTWMPGTRGATLSVYGDAPPAGSDHDRTLRAPSSTVTSERDQSGSRRSVGLNAKFALVVLTSVHVMGQEPVRVTLRGGSETPAAAKLRVKLVRITGRNLWGFGLTTDDPGLLVGELPAAVDQTVGFLAEPHCVYEAQVFHGADLVGLELVHARSEPFEVTVPNAGVANVRVANGTGEPIDGFVIVHSEFLQRFVAVTPCAAGASLRLVLPVGNYNVFAVAPGLTPAPFDQHQVKAGDTRDLLLRLETGGRAKVRLVDGNRRPIHGAVAAAPFPMLRAAVDERGEATIDWLGRMLRNVVVLEDPAGTHASVRVHLDHSSSETREIVLPKGVEVRGTLRLGDGARLQEITVGIASGSREEDGWATWRTGRIDENGRFSVAPVNPDCENLLVLGRRGTGPLLWLPRRLPRDLGTIPVSFGSAVHGAIAAEKVPAQADSVELHGELDHTRMRGAEAPPRVTDLSSLFNQRRVPLCSDGYWAFPGVAPGTYSVSLRRRGWEVARREIVVIGGAPLQVKFD